MTLDEYKKKHFEEAMKIIQDLDDDLRKKYGEEKSKVFKIAIMTLLFKEATEKYLYPFSRNLEIMAEEIEAFFNQQVGANVTVEYYKYLLDDKIKN